MLMNLKQRNTKARKKEKKKSRSQFLASFQTFGLTARVYLNLRKNTDYFAV